MTVPFTKPWEVQVSKLFLQGLGFEDIAVKLGCTADQVRRDFDRRQLDGSLSKLVQMSNRRWYLQAVAKWGK